jgi:sulfoxide reductase heme-binding subunit YedZ
MAEIPLSRNGRRFPIFNAIIHISAWFLVGWLVWDLLTGRMSVNPIQEITQRTGHYAIWFLIASLACTPLNTIFGVRQAINARRPLGLYAFMFASFHVLTFSGVDLGFQWQLLKSELLGKRYILVGATTFIILLILAITSTQGWRKRLGKGWKRLHRLIYLAGVLAVLHYAWAVKGNIFRLQGNIIIPFIAGILVILLLTFRIPWVKLKLKTIRGKIYPLK